MRRLLPILLLTIAVLLGSAGVSESAGKKNSSNSPIIACYDDVTKKHYPTPCEEPEHIISNAEDFSIRSPEATRIWESAKQGNVDAQFNLGAMYEDGKGVSQDYKTAVKWYTLAAQQGHADAQFNLGWIYSEGLGVPQDDKAAVKWYTRAAEQGDSKSQYRLGRMYYVGKIVPQDFKSAVRWIRLAAEQGHASAQMELGDMYHKGKGVSTDLKTAVKWYLLAAEQGHDYAQIELGDMYHEGKGVSPDLKTAVKWYLLAAEQSDAFFSKNYAIDELGKLHGHGWGVPEKYKPTSTCVTVNPCSAVTFQKNYPTKDILTISKRYWGASNVVTQLTLYLTTPTWKKIATVNKPINQYQATNGSGSEYEILSFYEHNGNFYIEELVQRNKNVCMACRKWDVQTLKLVNDKLVRVKLRSFQIATYKPYFE
jgi:TPR repeat protein